MCAVFECVSCSRHFTNSWWARPLQITCSNVSLIQTAKWNHICAISIRWPWISNPCIAFRQVVMVRIDSMLIRQFQSSTCVWTSTTLRISVFYAVSRLPLVSTRWTFVQHLPEVGAFLLGQIHGDQVTKGNIEINQTCGWGWGWNGWFLKDPHAFMENVDVQPSPPQKIMPNKRVKKKQTLKDNTCHDKSLGEAEQSTWLYASTYELALCLTSFAWRPMGDDNGNNGSRWVTLLGRRWYYWSTGYQPVMICSDKNVILVTSDREPRWRSNRDLDTIPWGFRQQVSKPHFIETTLDWFNRCISLIHVFSVGQEKCIDERVEKCNIRCHQSIYYIWGFIFKKRSFKSHLWRR